MAGSFPALRNGLCTALYPFTRRIVFDTGITFNSDGTERRWKRRAPLFQFDWTMNNLNLADVDALRTHHANQGGMAASDSSLSVGGTTYSNLAFQSDRFAAQRVGPNIYTVRMSAVQTQNRAYSTGSVPTAWPTFSSGAKFQYPMGRAWRNLTTIGESPTGTRYAYKWWSASVSGQPSRQLRAFDLQLMLPDADVATLETFFIGVQGRLNTFSLTEPETSTTYTKIRFDADSLELNYQDTNRVAVSVSLIETA